MRVCVIFFEAPRQITAKTITWYRYRYIFSVLSIYQKSTSGKRLAAVHVVDHVAGLAVRLLAPTIIVTRTRFSITHEPRATQ